jgi:hypothetical protein
MLSWQVGFLIAGIVGFIDSRFGFVCLFLVGLLALL